jgi:hypothetical protein
MPGQLFPEFSGYPLSLYQDTVWTVVAKDNLGHVATRQAVFQYDFTAPVLNCTNITVTSVDGSPVPVDFAPTATDDRPQPLRGPACDPPSGSLFPVGATTVTCAASDLCHNTNTCAFTVTVRRMDDPCGPDTLRIALTQLEPPQITLTWDCPGVLECATDLNGPWSDLAGVTSPLTLSAVPGNKFFRLRQSPP